MSIAIEIALDALKPTQRHAVMDLVQAAGIDIAPWAKKLDGSAVREPRANPHYCYEWAFGNEVQGFVLCVWHSTLKKIEVLGDSAIGFQDNVRDLALSLDRIAIDRSRPSHERNRARDQAARARSFDSAVQRSFRRCQSLKLIVNEGIRRPLEELGVGKSTVKLRSLDTAAWFVHAYDDTTGDTLIIRELGPPSSTTYSTALADRHAVEGGDPKLDDPTLAIPEDLPTALYVDQFSVPVVAAQHEKIVTVRERSASVRGRVLQRARGLCELCGQPGFVTAAGSIYLETHHVVSLSLDGPDHESNMVALCPNDHRRAHFGDDRDALSDTLHSLAARNSGAFQ